MKEKLMHVFAVIALLVTVASLAPSAGAVTYEVEIEDFNFIPGRLHINPGDAVEWTNRDGVVHSATSDEGIWDSGLLARDEVYTFTFTIEGIYPYHCSPHPWMVDTIVVGNPTSADDQLPSSPDRIELSQNYPNPFNARTSIEYALPFDSHVRIIVHNLLEQSIETLVNRDQPAGYHQVLWDAVDMPTGVYFYRIEAAGFTSTRKMLLTK